MHEASWEKIQIIEAPKEPPPAPPPQIFQKPSFTQPLQNLQDIPEGESALLECRVIPVNDPNLRLEWYFNEKPLQQSNRFVMTKDFGNISMLLTTVYAHDKGVYMCRAVNDLGEAVTTASVDVICKFKLI